MLGKDKPTLMIKTVVSFKKTEKYKSDLEKLLSYIFHETRNSHLVEPAFKLLKLIKEKGGWHSNQWRQYIDKKAMEVKAKEVNPLITGRAKTKGRRKPEPFKTIMLNIGGCVCSYTNLETILGTLRSARMLKKEGGVYKLDKEFSNFLDVISECWVDFV